MVDRYQSMVGSALLVEDIGRNVRADQLRNINREIVQRTNDHGTRMRELISKYKRNISKEADDYIVQFKEEQQSFARDRMMLKNELDRLERDKKKDTPEYNFMKK